jgi:hypothetical protein
MADRNRTHIHLAVLILCLSFSCLVLMNIQRTVHLCLDSFSGNYSDQQDIFPQIDIESEIALFGFVSLVSTACRASKYGPACLGVSSIDLTPHFPPPKTF